MGAGLQKKPKKLSYQKNYSSGVLLAPVPLAAPVSAAAGLCTCASQRVTRLREHRKRGILCRACVSPQWQATYNNNTQASFRANPCTGAIFKRSRGNLVRNHMGLWHRQMPQVRGVYMYKKKKGESEGAPFLALRWLRVCSVQPPSLARVFPRLQQLRLVLCCGRLALADSLARPVGGIERIRGSGSGSDVRFKKCQRSPGTARSLAMATGRLPVLHGDRAQ